MEPRPQHCLICGREITTGLDMHIRNTHEMDYDFYREYFYDCVGCYAVYQKGSKTVLTLTREVKPI